MEKIVILYMTDTFQEMAGSERNLYEIVSRIDPKQYRPVIVCHQGGELVGTVRARGIEIIDMKARKIYAPRALVKAWYVLRFMKREKVRIVVTYHSGSDFLGLVLAKLAGVPVVISSRRDMGYGLKPRHVLMYRVINRWFDKIIAVSDAVMETIVRRERVPCHKIITIHNGVDLEKFDVKTRNNGLSASLGLGVQGPIIGMPAVIRPIKGHRYFIEAAATVLREYPQVHFIAVGWHDNGSYFRELTELVKRFNIEKNVYFTGGRREIAEVLSLMDICVFSSINEGFSNAVIECMAAGKPVIATDRGGTPEAVIDGVTGILVPPKDSGKLAGAMLALLRNPSLASDMGMKGRIRAQRIFSMEKMIARTEDLYRQLLEEKTGSGIYGQRRIRRVNIKLAKGIVNRFLYYSGLCGYMHGKLHPAQGVDILAYHRIGSRTPIGGMSLLPSHFEAQIKYLTKHYTILSLENALNYIRRGAPTAVPAAVVTFDDGYKDNFIHAFPILKRYGVEATIFVTVGPIENREMLWFDLVAELFARTSERGLGLERYGIPFLSFETGQKRRTAVETVLALCKTMNRESRDRLITELSAKLGVDPGALKVRSPMLTWEDVIQMHEQGICIGSHGMTHTIMTRLTEKELEYEVADSKRIIRERTGIDVRYFAYPNGMPGDFGGTIGTMLRDHGYEAACTLIKGSNVPATDRYELRRYCVSEHMSSTAFGRHSDAMFALELSGIYLHVLKRMRRSAVKANAALPGEEHKEQRGLSCR